MPGNSCAGFNEAQIQQLNFGAMDFSEFIQTIVPKSADIASTANRVDASVTQKVKNYYVTP